MDNKEEKGIPRRTMLCGDETGIPGVLLLGHNRNFAAGAGIAPHVHQGLFELVYVVSGEICFETKDSIDVLHGGDIYLTQPNQVHSTGASPTGVCEFYWLHIDANASECLGLSKKASSVMLDELRKIQRCALYGQTRWEKEFESMMYAAKQKGNLSEEVTALHSICSLLPVLCDAVQRKDNTRRYTSDIEEALCYLEKNITEELTLTELAQVAGISVPCLKKKFMQQVGVPPRTYLNLAKIEAAKQMLCDGDSVTDTAFHFSFSSSGYFSTQFKKFTGKSPRQFKTFVMKEKVCNALPNERGELTE